VLFRSPKPQTPTPTPKPQTPDLLNLTTDEATPLFAEYPFIHEKLIALQEVGLGYLQLGQSATTLSGGEAQRIKLAKELSKRSIGHTLYILDEPTTGLHSHDISKLLHVLHKLVDNGHSVITIEHNLDVIKTSDHVIDIGPKGGIGGGRIVAQGTPEEVAANQVQLSVVKKPLDWAPSLFSSR
jgi:excinuclease ABC subunit A